MKQLIKKYPLLSFFAFAYVFSWGVQLPQNFIQGWPGWLSFFALFGPAVAAFVVMQVTGQHHQAREIMAALMRWKAGLQWYAAAILIPVLVMSAAFYVYRFFYNAELSGTAFPGLFPVIVYFTYNMVFVWGEEVGWRGYALPALQARFHPLAASLMLGVIWGAWHLPTFLISDSPQQNIPWPLYLLFIVVSNFLYSWIYNGTRGSLFLICIHHAMTNAVFLAYLAQPAFAPVIQNSIVMLIPLIILVTLIIVLTRFRLLADGNMKREAMKSMVYEVRSGS